MAIKQTIGLLLFVNALIFLPALAAENNIAIEDTIPEKAAEAYTLEQIPPIDTTEKKSNSQRTEMRHQPTYTENHSPFR